MELMIYADLDQTLINSERRFRDEIEVALDHGISEAEYTKAGKDILERDGSWAYSFRSLFQALKEKNPRLSPSILNDLEKLLHGNYFFPDTLEFLKQFSPSELIIVTRGTPEFQWPKIEAHKLTRYVGEVRITKGDKSEVMFEGDSYRKFLIDDSSKVIDEVKSAKPSVFCIQVRKPGSWDSRQEPADLRDAYCRNLLSAAKLIKLQIGRI